MSLGHGDGSDERFVSLTVAPMGGNAPARDHLVITVVDATETVRTRRELEAAEAAEKRIVEDLNATNALLNATNKDLQDANEELQAANEELMLAQEELQATNEEFEATNEELQATNEELETNNEELQATNEELDTTNEELQARTTELAGAEHGPPAAARAAGGDRGEGAAPGRGPAGGSGGRRQLQPSFRGDGRRRGRHRQRRRPDLRGAPEVADGLRRAVAKGEVWVSGPQAVVHAGSAKSPARTYVFTALPLYDDGDASGVAVFAQDVTDLARR